ncbi:Zn-dependent protease (includes SpoIVFB) [Altererythrobacter xiamenensis]|uniref:Zn-dependent protease (Includes SpoIVFB) n=1 Tax=Altererythrobacter xiamenensis TaxID=1316679 RepID=A0A1Y6F4T9_9SPHN|nr:site-2 protease family protein [Altererythrobacter xiamenensis]SMQ69904.1 Zn-dependent protease (includes SpoIVFB) [Altererythrobacter xiamenensis]
MTDTLTLAIVLIPALIVAIVFHEVAHGWTALALGDPTAKEQNRLSLNPLRHVDPVGTILVPGLLALMSAPIFGWAKPVPVRKDRLDNPRFGMMAVAAAGPGTNFVLAAVGAIALGLLAPTLQPDINAEPTLAVQGLFYFILINIFLGIFNLLPIPPFDGSHIVEGLMPRRYVHLYEKLRPFGMLLFLGLVLLTWFAPEWGVLDKTLGPPVEWALRNYLALANSIS